MEKLELKHLSPYLPYNIDCRATNGIDSCGNENLTLLSPLRSEHLKQWFIESFKPYLKPLKDIREDNSKEMLEFEYVDTDGYFNCYLKDRLTTNYDFFKLDGAYYKITQMPYDFVEYLISQHYDVFGLIEKGLAIDINTLEQTN